MNSSPERIAADHLLPAVEVQRRYMVSHMTLYRWLKDGKLGFPDPIEINRRRYWYVGDLVQWERGRAKKREVA